MILPSVFVIKNENLLGRYG